MSTEKNLIIKCPRMNWNWSNCQVIIEYKLMYVLSNAFSVIVYCFLLKAQCLLNYYLNISKISNDLFKISSTQELKKKCFKYSQP